MCFFKQILRRMNLFLQYTLIITLQRIGSIAYRYFFSKQKLKERRETYKILVVRLDEIGDMVMMSPFLRELRHNYPTSDITLIVKTGVYNLVEQCPYVNKVLCFPRAEGRWSFYLNLWRGVLFAYHKLRNENYDLAIVPRFDADHIYGAGIIAFLSQAEKRVGYSEYVLPDKSRVDKGYDGFYTTVFQSTSKQVCHEVARNLDVLRFCGKHISDTRLEIWTDEQDVIRAKALLQGSKSLDSITIAVAMAAGRRNKEWPVQSYVLVIKHLQREIPIQVVLLGAGEQGATYGRDFCTAVPNTINLINKTTLRESAELLRLCDCYLGVDTGLMHIAAALKMPGIALFANHLDWRWDGIDTPDRFGPWKSSIICLHPPCATFGDEGTLPEESLCIRGISVELVQENLAHIIKKQCACEGDCYLG